jgi:tetratricopeptide (TPR) repeat protein
MKLFFLYILLGYLLMGLGNPAPARADEDFEFYKKFGHSNKTWNAAVEAGFAAYEKQDCDASLTQLQEAIRLQAQDGLIYYKMAVCTELKGSPYTALQYYQLALEKLETLSAVHRYQRDIYENYGRALLKADRKKEAIPYLSRAAALGTPSFALFYLVGSLSGEAGDMGAALDYFKKAIAQDTTDVDPKLLSQVYFKVGKAWFDAKDYAQASPLLERAVQLEPENIQASQMLSDINLAKQQRSMVEMIDGLSKPGSTSPAGTVPGTQAPSTSPPTGPVPTTTAPGSPTPGSPATSPNLPPAAAKLPPLNPPPANPPAPAPAPPQ